MECLKLEIIDSIQSFNRKNGRPPKSKEMLKSKGYVSCGSIIKTFGSFNEGLRQSGFNTYKKNINTRSLSDEELLQKLRNSVINNNNEIPLAKNIEGLSSGIWYKRFGSYKNAIIKAGFNLMDFNIRHDSLSKEELIGYLIKFNKEIGYPTLRAMEKHKEYPCSNAYYNKFGSLKDALKIAGIYDEKRDCYFGRDKVEFEDVKIGLKKLIDDNIEKNRIITNDDIDSCDYLPHSSTVTCRLKINMDDAYSLCGYNRIELYNQFMEKDMIEKYLKLKDIIGKTPNSREIDRYSKKGFGYGSKTYCEHFGTIYNLQEMLGLEMDKNMTSRRKSRQDLKNDLIKLYEQLKRIPTVHDVVANDWCSSLTKYSNEFGTFQEALISVGLKPKYRVFYTNKKKLRVRSYFEWVFANMLEEYNIEYESETFYKDIIDNFKTNHRFDFKIEFNSTIYLVEVFGLMGYNQVYRDKTKWKIDICKENNIKLIEIYPSDISNNLDEVYNVLINKINSINQEEN